jgi:hypothetical protein
MDAVKENLGRKIKIAPKKLILKISQGITACLTLQ